MIFATVIAEFFSIGKKIKYAKGNTILNAGETPEGVYYISKGYVKAYNLTKEGNEHLFLIYKPGEIFPARWAWLQSENSSFYKSITPVELYRISRKEFVRFVNSTPKASLEFLDMVMSMFSIYISRVDNLEFNNARLRLIDRLYVLGKRIGIKTETGKVKLPIVSTHSDIASSINLTRETVSRECQILENEGFIHYEKRHIIHIDVDKLDQELYAHYE